MDGRLIGIAIGSSAVVAAGPVFRWIRSALGNDMLAVKTNGKGAASSSFSSRKSSDDTCLLTRCECGQSPGLSDRPVLVSASKDVSTTLASNNALWSESATEAVRVNSKREIGELSSRGERALQPIPGLYYFSASMEAAKDMYSPTTNPNGFINVSIAENMLMFDWLQEKLANRAPIEPEVARYNQITGMPRFKAAVAHTVQRLLLPRCPGLVSPENICVGAGVSAIVEHLAYTLCDAGEGVLIPAPFYPGFIGDFQLRNRVEIIPVATADQRLFQPTPEDCQSALEAAAARGVCVRTIVLTNPTNPHGTVWPEAAVAALVAWALQAGLHVIADEVYSASVFGDGVPECVSGVELAERLVAEGKASREEVDDRVHLTYGMSKDFTLNGFRVGILFSRNRKLLTALRMVNIFSWVSQDTQWALSSLLEDDAWVDAFLAENKKRLHRSHQLICSTLQELSIPFVPSGAAMFVFADMRRFLSAPTFEAEKQLWTDIKDGAKLVMVPGESCRAPEPGYFRLCFSSVPYEHLEVACARLFAFFNARAVKSLETPAG